MGFAVIIDCHTQSVLSGGFRVGYAVIMDYCVGFALRADYRVGFIVIMDYYINFALRADIRVGFAVLIDYCVELTLSGDCRVSFCSNHELLGTFGIGYFIVDIMYNHGLLCGFCIEREFQSGSRTNHGFCFKQC